MQNLNKYQFRFWHYADKKIYPINALDFEFRHVSYTDCNKCVNYSFDIFEGYLMQHIGCGIYEGDILSWSKVYSTVDPLMDLMPFTKKIFIAKDRADSLLSLGKIDKLGNMFTHPELMKEYGLSYPDDVDTTKL